VPEAIPELKAIPEEILMSVYRVVDIIGTSPNSWEEAAREAITTASKSLRNLRVAEVSEFDVTVNDAGQIEQFRVKLKVSFKYESN
jgi:dodecin